MELYAKRFKGQKRIFLRVSMRILLDNSISFASPRSCFLAKTIHQQFNMQEGDVSVNPDEISFYGNEPDIESKIENRIRYKITNYNGYSGFLNVFRRARKQGIICCDSDELDETALTVILERIDKPE